MRSTSPRTSRADPGMRPRPTAQIRLHSPGPSTVMVTSATSTSGNASSTSRKRVMARSHTPLA
ncbi:hypothetical protein H490_0113435 [Leucobacter sp. UCD-THU]|nr:hypothetical protein H490_0113435 [Leucobacter sp. UCD-THU]